MKTAGELLNKMVTDLMEKDKTISFSDAFTKVQLKNRALSEIYSSEIRFLCFAQRGSRDWKKHFAFVSSKVNEFAEQESISEGISFNEALNSVFDKNPGLDDVYFGLLGTKKLSKGVEISIH